MVFVLVNYNDPGSARLKIKGEHEFDKSENERKFPLLSMTGKGSDVRGV